MPVFTVFNIFFLSYLDAPPPSLGHPQASNARRHEATHRGDKPFWCRFCDYKTAERPKLSRHELVHTGEKPYSCAYCEYVSVPCWGPMGSLPGCSLSSQAFCAAVLSMKRMGRC